MQLKVLICLLGLVAVTVAGPVTTRDQYTYALPHHARRGLLSYRDDDDINDFHFDTPGTGFGHHGHTKSKGVGLVSAVTAGRHQAPRASDYKPSYHAR